MRPVLCQLNESNGNVITDGKLILNVARLLHRDLTNEIKLSFKNNSLITHLFLISSY